jgi:hypothetical protein
MEEWKHTKGFERSELGEWKHTKGFERSELGGSGGPQERSLLIARALLLQIIGSNPMTGNFFRIYISMTGQSNVERLIKFGKYCTTVLARRCDSKVICGRPVRWKSMEEHCADDA